MALTRLLSQEKMERHVIDLVLDHERLPQVCMTLKTTGAEHTGAYPDAGLHLYSALHPLSVMRGGFGDGSKF
jgi:hypothetical protein